MGDLPLLSPPTKWAIRGFMTMSVGVAALSVDGINQFTQQFIQLPSEIKQAVQLQPEPRAIAAASNPTTLVRTAITALGRIEPQGEVIIVGGPLDERIGQLLVKEGQQVEAGQPLVYLESYQERLAERNAAASELTEAQALLASETQLGQAQIQEARSRVSQATDPKSAAILAQQAEVNQAKVELAAAQRDLDRFQRLYEAGAVSQKDLDDRQVAVQAQQDRVTSAQATLAQLQEERQTDLQNANAQVQSAEAELARSQAQVKVASATSNLQLAEARLARTIIRAPQAGQVLDVMTRAGEAVGDTGILELANTQQMMVVAEVYETDVQQIQVGQAATITSPALPQPVSGVVEQVGLKIAKNDVIDNDPAANTDVRVVEVKIRLKNSQTVASFTNLQVDVAIQPETR